MKLEKKHLFLILLLSIVFCCGLGVFGVVEGMDNKENTSNNEHNKKNNNKRKNNEYIPQSNINGNDYNSTYSEIDDTNTSMIKVVSTDDGRVIYATPQNTIHGISSRNIPAGQEDLYILKSQVVPPVCPACPTIINKCNAGGGSEKCPPCPPCGRCPEASFECVKRPTYKPDNPYLPVPVLSDFSSFGM